jgi:hypothetical protein
MPKKPEKKLTGIPQIPHPHRSALVSEPSDFFEQSLGSSFAFTYSAAN